MKVLGIITCLILTSTLVAQEKWRLVYEHDEQGNLIHGSKEILLESVRRGSDVKVGWRMGNGEETVEHFSEVQFLTIMDGEVYGQITPILSQNPSIKKAQVTIRNGLKWSFIAGTNGKNSTYYYSSDDGTVLDQSIYRWGNKWYVRE